MRADLLAGDHRRARRGPGRRGRLRRGARARACSARSAAQAAGADRAGRAPSRGRRWPPGSPRRPRRWRRASRARTTSSALAAARTALLGAVHDALIGPVAEATGRPRRRERTAPRTGGAGQPANLLGRRPLLAVRPGHRRVAGRRPRPGRRLGAGRLRDAARRARRCAGWRCCSTASPPSCGASCPGATLERVPGPPLGRPVVAGDAADAARRGRRRRRPARSTGRLLPLGVDLHEHATAVQAQVHAVLEPADGAGPRLVRASVVARRSWTRSSAPASGSCCARTCRCWPPLAERPRAWTSPTCR